MFPTVAGSFSAPADPVAVYPFLKIYQNRLDMDAPLNVLLPSSRINERGSTVGSVGPACQETSCCRVLEFAPSRGLSCLDLIHWLLSPWMKSSRSEFTEVA